MSLKRELLEWRDKVRRAVEFEDEALALEVDDELSSEGWSTDQIDRFVEEAVGETATWKALVER